MDKELTKLRKSYEKNLLNEIKEIIKASDWNKYQDTIFKEVDGLFFVVTVRPSLKKVSTAFQIRVKPISIDPLLWDIMGMPENNEEPLSFRAWAAFRCDEIPLHSSIMEIDDTYDFKEVAVRIFNWANASIEECREELLENRFSDFVKADQDHIKEGAYVSTLITSLISEGDLKEAFNEAQSYESGEKNSCSSMNKDGKSFFTHTLEWLSDHDYDANKA